MKAIVNVDNNWGIGIGDKLLNHIPADMKFFKETTTGNTVVMGRATFMTFPGPRALPNRKNIVLTTDKSWNAPDVTVCHSVGELLDLLEGCDTDSVFVIGGSMVYEQLLPYCNTAYVTKVDSAKPADKFFPDLDKTDEWEIESEGEKSEHNGVEFRFVTYKRLKGGV
ncbi:MAG: dihydrofolate reductase [Lachnospiraceae bacterium]|nr:dihydrofolate reductase [Lachnospiraceae bacterium]